MGSAPIAPPGVSFSQGLCRKVSETLWNITVLCHLDAYDVQTITMNKTRSKAPTWAIDKMKEKRQLCGTCPLPPTWKYGADTGKDLPKGAEASYGIPFRWSASRLLAADVKQWLCGKHHNDTTICRNLINDTAWGLESFIDHFTHDASKLFHNQDSRLKHELPMLSDAISQGNPYDDSQLWDGPDAAWVGCSQETDGKCHGGIPKSEWLSPARGEKCVDVFTSLVKNGVINESTVSLDICTLSSDLSAMCDALAASVKKVQTANCILTEGRECQPSEWLYTPSMYSVNNQQFVRSTVINFYETFGIYDSVAFVPTGLSNHELVCPLDNEDREIRERNDVLTQSCASRQLERVKDSIKIARYPSVRLF
jgi:hypothetical protein